MKYAKDTFETWPGPCMCVTCCGYAWRVPVARTEQAQARQTHGEAVNTPNTDV
jgi:hypothetical protein